jgi:hypothetical protein
MRTFPTVLLLAGAATAQAHVSPAIFTRMEGSTWSAAGLGAASAPSRLLQVHDDVPARAIAALTFRRDGQTTTSYPAVSLLYTLSMSTAATRAAQPSATFDANHGTDRRVVVNNGVVQFPATTHQGYAAPFDYRLPLPMPYQHTGTGPLCFDLQVTTSSSNSTMFFDAATGVNANPGGLTELVGRGCRRTATSSPATMSGSFQPNWPASTMTLALNGSSLPPTTLGLLGLGDSTTQWAGLTLPFELPGTATAPSGPCSLLSSMLITLPQFTNNNGGFSASVSYVPHPSMRGRNFYFQMVAPDAAANAFGLVLSNSVRFHPYAPWTTVPIGSVDAVTLGGTGTVRANSGQIVAFE